MSALYVFVGGGIGAVLRYGIACFVKNNFASYLPIATFISNVLSCIILGLFVYKFQSLSSNYKLLFIMGVCGGFSTFSTFSYETLELINSGNWSYAVANVLISVFTCLLVLFLMSKA